ncbi:MAG: M28 family metallopeptidase [Thermoplasmata archaeon]
MLPFKLDNKKAILLIVLLLLLPILGYLLWVSPSLLGRSADIELYPLEVQSGMLTEFTVKTGGNKGVVRLPSSTLPVIDGKVSTVQNLSFEDNEFTFWAIIPPTASMVNITVDLGQHSKTFQIQASKGAKTFVSGEQVHERMEYVTDYSNNMFRRVTSHPQLERGARYFEGLFTSFGLEAEVVRYWDESGDSPRDRVIGMMIWNVVAYHWGENTKEWIVLGGHYDVAPGTIEGAYDNTGGSNLVVEVARGISQIKTNKTIVFGLWAGEEEGLWGASEFVDSIPEDVTVKAYLNFDMAGLNYPAPYELQALIGPDEDPELIEQGALINLTNRTAYEILDYPKETGVLVTEDPFGRSDHVRFQNIGVSTVFFFGAGDDEYSAYHSPDDTLEEMERVAGSKELLIGGFETVAWMGFYLTVLLDNDDTVHQNI